MESMTMALLPSSPFDSRAGSARVVLDDDALVEEVAFALGHDGRPGDAYRHARQVERQPGRRRLRLQRLLEDLEILRALPARCERDDVALADLGGGDVDLAAVEGDEPVSNQLARLG